jgi:hypothetical protein
MRFTYFAAAVGIASLLPASAVLVGASAHADVDGYSRCVANITQVPLGEPNPQNLQLVGSVQQDLNAGVSPAAEAQKLTQMGFDARLANGIVQCVIREHP